jgi:hypothetical protein
MTSTVVHTFIRRSARLAFSVVVFGVCAELVAVAWHLAQTGRLFYTEPVASSASAPAAGDRLQVGDRVHPYFGFAYAAGVPFHDERTTLLDRDGWRAPPARDTDLPSNNFGFLSPHTYPLAKTSENQFFVGIFGGSVGMWFCQVGAPRLVEELKRHPFFRTREIVPLCFGYSGYKQPQQALVLAYFLSRGQTLDLAVNIDGFNDVALAALNHERGLDISMPSVLHMESLVNLVNQSTLTPAKIESLAAIVRDRSTLANIGETRQRNPSAAVDRVLAWYAGRVRDRYEAETVRFAELPSNPRENSLVQLTPPAAARSRAAAFDEMAALWARSSVLMRDLLTTRGGTYVHFLQPNQYFTKRRFSDAEAATALNDASPFKRGVEEGYPALQAAARTLVANKIFYFDATRALDDEPSPAYIDDCCHYTVIGNRVLADFVAASILATPGPWNN